MRVAKPAVAPIRFAIAAAVAIVLTLSAASPATARGPACGGRAAAGSVGHPTARLAWKAAPVNQASVYRGIPGRGGIRRGSISAATADWLLVLEAGHSVRGHCWVKLRLPGRPNDSAGWVNTSRLLLRPTRWRLEVSLARRGVTVYEAGHARRSLSAVVGAPATPTPRGLFSIVHAWPSDPHEFVGAWVLGLTAHSEVLRSFEGGSGEVGIHGRGGASLLDPLGSAASHGCVRLANRAIEWLVRTIGGANLPGIPVRIR